MISVGFNAMPLYFDDDEPQLGMDHKEVDLSVSVALRIEYRQPSEYVALGRKCSQCS